MIEFSRKHNIILYKQTITIDTVFKYNISCSDIFKNIFIINGGKLLINILVNYSTYVYLYIYSLTNEKFQISYHYLNNDINQNVIII